MSHTIHNSLNNEAIDECLHVCKWIQHKQSCSVTTAWRLNHWPPTNQPIAITYNKRKVKMNQTRWTTQFREWVTLSLLIGVCTFNILSNLEGFFSLSKVMSVGRCWLLPNELCSGLSFCGLHSFACSATVLVLSLQNKTILIFDLKCFDMANQFQTRCHPLKRLLREWELVPLAYF